MILQSLEGPKSVLRVFRSLCHLGSISAALLGAFICLAMGAIALEFDRRLGSNSVTKTPVKFQSDALM